MNLPNLCGTVDLTDRHISEYMRLFSSFEIEENVLILIGFVWFGLTLLRICYELKLKFGLDFGFERISTTGWYSRAIKQ